MADNKYSFVTQADYEMVAGEDWPPFSTFVEHRNVPEFVYREIDSMLSAPVEFAHPSFCVLPFYGVEYPDNIACCLMLPGSNRITVQQEMLRGDRPQACIKCWNLEDSGFKSDRQIKNSSLEFYSKRDLAQIFQDCANGFADIVHYKIDTNNVCNATCVTCTGALSSAWAKLEKANNLPLQKTWQITPATTDLQINYSTARSIMFRGGEPFMSKTNFHVLEQLIKHNNTECFISFVTNGGFNLTSKQHGLISRFPNTNFCFSIDGVGPVFEYLRYPLKFDQIVRNIEFCKSNQIAVSASYTLSNLNVLYHSQTVKWFNDHQIEFVINPVYHPAHFRPEALPEQVKHHINSVNASTNLVLTHGQRDDADYANFKKEIAKQDRWKNIQLKHYLPELAALLDQ